MARAPKTGRGVRIAQFMLDGVAMVFDMRVSGGTFVSTSRLEGTISVDSETSVLALFVTVCDEKLNN
jgi:hypothetical protein